MTCDGEVWDPKVAQIFAFGKFMVRPIWTNEGSKCVVTIQILIKFLVAMS